MSTAEVGTFYVEAAYDNAATDFAHDASIRLAIERSGGNVREETGVNLDTGQHIMLGQFPDRFSAKKAVTALEELGFGTELYRYPDDDREEESNLISTVRTVVVLSSLHSRVP
jgi:hypothetical protein